MESLARLFAVPDPEQRVRFWHVSPAVDVAAYHWSWVWILIPLLFTGSKFPDDYWGWFILATIVGFTHRHATLPYVYLDRQVFDTHPVRFVLWPVVLGLLFLFSPWAAREFIDPYSLSLIHVVALASLVALMVQGTWAKERGHVWTLENTAPAGVMLGLGAVLHYLSPSLAGFGWLFSATTASFLLGREASKTSGQMAWAIPGLLGTVFVLSLVFDDLVTFPRDGVRGKTLIGVATFIAVLWNIWHTFMQKYGIFRLYAAKSEVGPDLRVPGWVDRLIIFGWFPLWAVWLAPGAIPRIKAASKSMRPIMWVFHWLVDTLQANTWWLLPAAAGLVLFAMGAWLYHEHRATGLRNRARLGMFVGTMAACAAFLVFDPVKVYIGWGFSHAVEYLVFIWAYQRRRYSSPLEHQPLWGRLLNHSWMWYVGSMTAVGLAYLVLKYHDDLWGIEPWSAFGTKTWQWAQHWVLWQSILHFYYDGFLWKMRLKTVRASI